MYPQRLRKKAEEEKKRREEEEARRKAKEEEDRKRKEEEVRWASSDQSLQHERRVIERQSSLHYIALRVLF